MRTQNTGIIIIGLICALMLALIGCNSPQPIGGDKDPHGCLASAGYSWNEEIGACARTWELDENQVKAAKSVVITMSASPVTVLEVMTQRCPGCFNVRLQTADNPPFNVQLVNWTIVQEKDCSQGCPMLSAPSPEFCKNGRIVPGGKDECDCQLPPKCEQVACTEDAKACPDGSYVGRVAPSCEFAPCPEKSS